MKIHLINHRWIVAVALAFCLANGPGCDKDEAAFDQPALQELEMTYTASEVSEIRKKADLDARALAIDGVLSVGVTGQSNEDAWLQIMCLNDSVAAHARTILGDSLDGVPIKFAISDTIRAQ